MKNYVYSCAVRAFVRITETSQHHAFQFSTDSRAAQEVFSPISRQLFSLFTKTRPEHTTQGIIEAL